MAPTVVLASPRASTRRRWARLLGPVTGPTVLGEARTAPEVLAWAGRRPQVLLLDGVLCEREGAALVRALRRRCPRTRVLVVTGGRPSPLEVLAHGARGYLHPDDLPAFLAKAVHAVHRGEAWVPRRMVARVLDRLIRLTAPAGRPPR